ncbi:MAG: carboxypeptidase-like regulatory domain-containing protein [Acidobacteria bacterium]|nr:carboxypeptidase-like regulatory domain-containing protein [Acidobacteriota bacterium]MDW7984390.1 carboxypeptidase-like regulatory domain-containing protein [Acidobacteriota bacterium]
MIPSRVWLSVMGGMAWLAAVVGEVDGGTSSATAAPPSPRPVPTRTGSARLDGTVYDTESRPIAGIRLVLRPRAEANVTFETITDARGRYGLDRLAGGYYEVLLRWGDRTVVQVTVWLAHGRAHRVDFYIDRQRLKTER